MSTIVPAIKDGSPALLPYRKLPFLLQGVFERREDNCRLELILDWEDSYLEFKVDEDTDSLISRFHDETFSSEPDYRSLGDLLPWRDYLGRECGWTWLGVNQQGYWDSAMLSFAGIIPMVLLNVRASSIDVFKILLMENREVRDH